MAIVQEETQKLMPLHRLQYLMERFGKLNSRRLMVFTVQSAQQFKLTTVVK